MTAAEALRFTARINVAAAEIRPGLGCCWEWTGGHSAQGYGRFRADGKSRSVHRLSWEFHRGRIPDDLHVLHRCDNRNCVNPGHLFLGTNTDNIADRVAKGRSHRANAVLSESDVIDIRTLAGLARRRDLARAFAVSREQIRDIINRKRWAAVA